MILLHFYCCVVLVAFGMLLAWSVDRDDGVDPHVVFVLLLIAAVVPLGVAAVYVMRMLSSARWRLQRFMGMF